MTSLWLALSGRESHSTLGRQWGDCTPARGASWPQEDDLPFGPCGSCPVPGESWSASVCRDGLGGVARPFAVQSGAARPALLSRPPLLLPSLPSQRASGAGAAVHCLRSRHLVPLGTGWAGLAETQPCRCTPQVPVHEGLQGDGLADFPLPHRSSERESSHSRLEAREAAAGKAAGSQTQSVLRGLQNPPLLVLRAPP